MFLFFGGKAPKCLVFKEILLRLAGSWGHLCGAQTKGDGMLGKKMAMKRVEALRWREVPRIHLGGVPELLKNTDLTLG